MIKSMSMHKKDNRGETKSNFVTSCLTFNSSILTESILELDLRETLFSYGS